MLMKDLMKEKGIFNDDTKVITCPSCGCKSIYDSGHILAHDSDCVFLKACRSMSINPYDYNDERVMKVLEVNDMFEKDTVFYSKVASYEDYPDKEDTP